MHAEAEFDTLEALQKEEGNLDKRKKEFIQNNRSKYLKIVKNYIDYFKFEAHELGFLEKEYQSISSNVDPISTDLVQKRSHIDSKILEGKENKARTYMYFNPDNPSEKCYGGQGNKPKWFMEYIKRCVENGMTKEEAREQMLIKKMRPLSQPTEASEAQSTDSIADSNSDSSNPI